MDIRETSAKNDFIEDSMDWDYDFLKKKNVKRGTGKNWERKKAQEESIRQN